MARTHVEESLAGHDVQVELEAAGEEVLLLGAGPEPVQSDVSIPVT